MYTSRLVSRLFKLFIPSVLEKIPQPIGFMKRYSKLRPETFAKADPEKQETFKQDFEVLKKSYWRKNSYDS